MKSKSDVASDAVPDVAPVPAPVAPEATLARARAVDAEPTPVPAPAAERRTVEAWREAKSTLPAKLDWQFAGAKTGERWPDGAELTEAEYDAAIERVLSAEHR